MDHLPASSGSGSFANRFLGPENHINHTSLDICGDRQISQIHILEQIKFKIKKKKTITFLFNGIVRVVASLIVGPSGQHVEAHACDTC